MNRIRWTLICISVFFTMTGAGPVTAQMSYTEDFTSTDFKDSAYTTAAWDTVAGELKLPAFTPSLLGVYDSPGDCRAVEIDGNFAFVADGPNGLLVIDVTDSANPVLLGSYNTPGIALGVAVTGNYVLVADDGSGLSVIDVTDPTSPTLAGAYASTDRARAVVIDGDLAYLADGAGGLVVLDITSPAVPKFVGVYDTPSFAAGVAISGNLALVADGYNGLIVLDITDSANPVFLDSFDSPGYANTVAVSGFHAFLADGTGGLVPIDISDPAAIVPGTTFSAGGSANSVAVDGDLAFVSNAPYGFSIVDITNPGNPSLANSYDAPINAFGVVVDGSLVYVATSATGLQIVEISQTAKPFLVTAFDTPGIAVSVTVSGNLALVGEYMRLHILDITDLASPVLNGTYETTDEITGVAVSGNLALLAAGIDGLHLIDISNPASPVLVGVYDTPYKALDVVVSGDLALVPDWQSGLLLIDISNPTSPVLAGAYDPVGGIGSVDVTGDLAIVANSLAGLQMIDIADPTNPVIIGEVSSSSGFSRVVVSRNYAFGTTGGPTLWTIDITDPTSPLVVSGGSTWGNNADDVTVSGNLAYVAVEGNGLMMFDITYPPGPVFAGIYHTPGSIRDIKISGEHAFAIDSVDDLMMIRVGQHEVFETGHDAGGSLVVDGASDMVVRARLATTQTDSVTWQLSADSASSWQDFTPGSAWMSFTNGGNDLLWRADFRWVDAGIPAVSELGIEWLNDFAPIASISDVPGDQGGWVYLDFTRSGYDFADEATHPVTGYNIYQRVDAAATKRSTGIVSGGEGGYELTAADGSIGFSLPGERVGWSDGIAFVDAEANPEKAAGAFPAGTWALVSSVFATQGDSYLAKISTLADSTATGTNWDTFLITTHTTTPSVWYVSYPDSGYSVDNLAPGVPAAITAAYMADSVVLDWGDAPEADFQYYRVYRDTDPQFVPAAGNLVQEVAVSAWTDPTSAPWGYYYKITALDYAGNEGEAGWPASVSEVQDGIAPLRTSLQSAVPNPFNPSTRLSFEMSVSGHVRMRVYDTAGRLVNTLLDEDREAGKHHVIWDGRDASGHMSAAGVYLYRLEAGSYTATQRMVLIK